MTDRLNTRRIPKDSVEPQFATILALKGALVVELRGGLNKSINRLGS